MSGMPFSYTLRLFYIPAILMILGGLLATSGLIVSKKPDAKEALAKLTPYQGIIGVALLGYCAYYWITWLEMFKGAMHFSPILPSLTFLAWFIGGLLLGFILGMPQIAKWIPGESNAETKVVELQQKLLPFQTIFGIIGLVDGLLLFLYGAGILK